MLRPWIVGLLVGCPAPSSDSPIPASPDWTVSCGVSPENALRLICEATGPESEPIEVMIVSRGISEAPVQAKTLTPGETAVFWGFIPEETVQWTATSDGETLEGSVQLDPLPEGLQVDWLVEGQAEVGPFLVNQPCGNTAAIFVVDSQGRTRWYQDFPNDSLPSFGGSIHAYGATPEGTVLVGLQREELRELHLDGTALRTTTADVISPGARFHHDAHHAGDFVYALFAEAYTCPDATYVLDGFQVYDSQFEPVQTWRLGDHLDPCMTGGPAGGFWQSTFDLSIDWSHANSVWASGSNDQVLLSLRHQDTILAVHGPDSPDWPNVQWSLTGTLDHSIVSDFEWTPTADGSFAGFDGQHNAMLGPQGTVTLFDNSRSDLTDGSRGLEVALDGDTATVVAEWPLTTFCDIQGSTQILEDRTALVTCATEARVALLDEFQSTPLWSLAARCPDGTNPNSIARFAPGTHLPL